MGIRLSPWKILPDAAGASRMPDSPAESATAYACSGAAMARTDGVLISAVLSAVDKVSAMHTAKLTRVATALQRGSYRVHATATSRAIVEDALLWSSLA